MRRYSAWRFCHPDFDETGELAGLGVSPTGGIQMVEGNASIRQSILLLLSQNPGERVMRPDFGCGIHDFVFAAINTANIGLIESSVREALTTWEPRIELKNVSVSTENVDQGQLIISIDYTVRTTNNEFNMVYPFYLTEGA